MDYAVCTDQASNPGYLKGVCLPDSKSCTFNPPIFPHIAFAPFHLHYSPFFFANMHMSKNMYNWRMSLKWMQVAALGYHTLKDSLKYGRERKHEGFS